MKREYGFPELDETPGLDWALRSKYCAIKKREYSLPIKPMRFAVTRRDELIPEDLILVATVRK